MPTISEAANAVSQGNSDITGLNLTSRWQNITFFQYTRYVLPLDGYVFWLKTQATTIAGSLHVTVQKRQEEDQYPAVNTAIFSTGREVEVFNEINPDTIWVAEYNGAKFAFSRVDVYEAANLFHYTGTAVYPSMATQLVDTGSQLDPSQIVVSNSLPAWLALKDYNPVWLVPANPGITLYPSFLVPMNVVPPYGVVDIDSRNTEALQPIPLIKVRTITPGNPVVVKGADHYQLAKDRVKVTLFGVTNDAALDFLDLVNQYSLYEDTIGIMRSPAIMRDEKQTHPELGIIAMKKTIEWEVSYYQTRMNYVARQLILHALVTFYDNPFYI